MTTLLEAKRAARGFTLLEALVALLMVSIGLFAAAKLQSTALFGSADAKSRSEAVTLSQRKIDELRNTLRWPDYQTLLANAANVCSTTTGANATFQFCYTVSDPSPALNPPGEEKLLRLTTTWTDRNGGTRSVNLASLVAWNNPLLEAYPSGSGGTPPSPTGSAQEGRGAYSPIPVGATNNGDGLTATYNNNGTKELIERSTGRILLTLAAVNNQEQFFTTISGRIYFDQNAGNNQLPSSDNVRVRLSSEGVCVYNNAHQSLVTAPTNPSNSYKYFTYTCYVGPGWYGNVGVLIDDSVNGNAGNPTICVGDPTFNGGVNDGTLIAANPVEAATRSYRGFVAGSGTYLSDGVPGGRSYNSDGLPKPSSYPSYYPGVTAGGSSDYFNHHFLLTSISGNGSCASKMAGGEFTRNAGQYYCLSPVKDVSGTIDGVCPNVWPNFSVGNGGTINYTLTVALAGSGTGTVTSSPAGISCGSTCSASYATGTSVILTPAAAGGSVFTGWSGGGCSGTGTCTVSVSAAQTVTATFDTGTTMHTLTVAKTGTGTGMLTSTPSGISCGTTCSYDFAHNTSVTLTAAAGTGSTFTGWSGGGCSGAASTCTVTMSAAQSVTATFGLSAPSTYTLTVTKSGTGTGTVTSSPTGINCGSTCSTSFSTGTAVTLTATPSGGSYFGGWSGACTGTGTCTVTMSQAQSVTALFNPPCTTTITGSGHDPQGTVSLSPAATGSSCAMANGNSVNYSCTLTHASGTQVTLTNTRTGGQGYTYSLSVTANCLAQTNVNFP